MERNRVKRGSGVSIKLISSILVVAALIVIVFSLFELRQTMEHAQLLYELEQQRQTCDTAIQKFMDGSDYLTDQAQQFAVHKNRRYMDDYWVEVYQTRSRDRAIEQILGTNVTQGEHAEALAGKAESDALIQGEVYAMRLVCESIGMSESDMPADVAACRLSATDAALTAEHKQQAAVAYLFGSDYFSAKLAIRGNVTAFRNEITARYSTEAIDALSNTKSTSTYMAMCIIGFLALLAGAILCFTGQVVTPLVRYARELNDPNNGTDLVLQEHGALEIRQFARVFNNLYEQVRQNTKRLERLGYMDYLTDVPNRASVTEYVNDLIAREQQPLGVLIVDVDNFKHFNDAFGHALGDQVLKRVAQAVCSVQPRQSGISGRICGEEFVVVSQNADEQDLRDTAERVLQNVRRVTAADVGLPDGLGFRVTVSVGGMIWRGEKPADFVKLLSMADKALYVSKQSGKDRFTLYE